ncbi:MAG: hypothetical protein ABEI86_06195 [Halobacteriaceae archaeon]
MDRRSNQEIIEAALWDEFGGERKSAIQRRIEEKKRRISNIESEKNERERELEEQQEELEKLQRQLNQWKQEEENELEEALEKCEDIEWSVENPGIQTQAENVDMDPAEFIEKLEEYYD